MDKLTEKTVLVVDDDPGQRGLIEAFLLGQGFRVETAKSGAEAQARLAEGRPGMLISDVRMPGMTGLELLERVTKTHPGLPMLLVTAYPEIRDAVGAMRNGALDYLEKPIDLDELLAMVRRSLAPDSAARDQARDLPPLPPGVVAQSAAMQAVLRECALAAPSEARLLVTGESGAGKEVVADIIHQWSTRAEGPLVKVNCAAIPENLLESELFGHEKGAFTGAHARRLGRFEEADGGTLLLDEIGEMSPALQAKLLRVTQDGTFNRVGSNAEQRVNVRILAATNRDLEREVAEGRFREDLYYRLNVMEIAVPPLRARRADIVPMALRFAEAHSSGKARFSPGALAAMEAHDWPGNVRELRNAMERAALLARGGVILAEHLPARVQQAAAAARPEPAEEAPPTGGQMEDIERAAILRALREHRFNRSETARALGISRRTLTYRLREYRDQGYTVDPE
ncbi:MAG: sigma-54-dependent Fis family transcriptional regulator [Candidatus Hydrogenedens sp.]|nr:sigma-54-dependent Fis family transcriptional regulator [Candidatus Hydrogenedentota bacterium]NLF57387.1 sigma-54-dependent Fis family transcriptional regulator [Candidatus Hydrogenedens sp.]